MVNVNGRQGRNFADVSAGSLGLAQSTEAFFVEEANVAASTARSAGFLSPAHLESITVIIECNLVMWQRDVTPICSHGVHFTNLILVGANAGDWSETAFDLGEQCQAGGARILAIQCELADQADLADDGCIAGREVRQLDFGVFAGSGQTTSD